MANEGAITVSAANGKAKTSTLQIEPRQPKLHRSPLTAHRSPLTAHRSPLTAHVRLILYQRDDCHLCDQAIAVLAHARVPEFDSVFIDDDAGLEARYGARVPVLRDVGSGREIDWPFDALALAGFVGEAG